MINISSLINVQLLTYNSELSFLKFPCQILLKFSILNFDYSPTAQYVVLGALLHVFFVALFLVAIIITEKKSFKVYIRVRSKAATGFL